jgi:hypothetical protein
MSRYRVVQVPRCLGFDKIIPGRSENESLHSQIVKLNSKPATVCSKWKGLVIDCREYIGTY